MQSWRWVFLVAILILIPACGDNGKSGEVDGDSTGAQQGEEVSPETDSDEPLANEDDLAQSLLLTVNDFPAGWSETPADEAEESPFDECDEGDPPGQTGFASTGDFSSGNTAEVSQEVIIFETADDATSSLDRIQGLVDCLIEVVEDGKLDNDEARYTDPSFGALSFPAYGDVADAYRFEVRAEAIGESGLGSEGTVYIDIVRVLDGRIGFAIQAVDVFSPFNTSTLESIVSDAYDKVSAAQQ